jgi:uncharacterized protein
VAKSLIDYLHTPNWRRQHAWRWAVWKNMARVGLTGLHALPVSKLWVETHRRPMPYKTLDPKLVGMRIVQMSDLHYSPMVWSRYLNQFVQWVNELKPDLVVVTGDLVTGGYRWSRKIAGILEHLQSTHGTVCTFGNHDYSLYGKRVRYEGLRRADYLEKCLQERGMIVLRNEVLQIYHNQSKRPLIVVGLDDEWSGHIDPVKAFQNVDATDAVLCLNHNPANAEQLLVHPWEWMLSGHTHGRQLAHGRVGRTLYGHLHRRYTHGYYSVAGRHLYVNRGLSYGQRIKHWCRPEITLFRLTSAPQAT